MSFNNFSSINPLIATYHDSTYSESGSIMYMDFDTSLHNGTVSSNTLTLNYPCTLRGDWYGYLSSTQNGSIVNSQFNIDGQDKYQSRDHVAGFGGGNIGGPEVFFGDSPANVNIKARYRTAGSSVTVSTYRFFPRITGILIK